MAYWKNLNSPADPEKRIWIRLRLGTREVSLYYDYNNSISDTSATNEEIRDAVCMLESLVNDPLFATSGRRNKDAVNMCCALRTIGYNPTAWLLYYCAVTGRVNAGDVALFLDHVDRVEQYVEGWGPDGNEGHALSYCI